MDAALNDNFKPQIRTNELLTTFDTYLPKIKVLSLDCFDTIIWRNTATPTDVFYTIQQASSFKSLGFTANLRIQAEKNARQKKIVSHTSNEVTLTDIYLASYPTLSPTEINTLIEAEMNAEKNACYAFPPIIDLIRNAHANGIKIIIVSDTYLSEPQLRELLAHVLPPDVLSMIADIFCSSEYGQSKAIGLFQQVLKKLGEKPHSILHIGDSQTADYKAPRALGMHAVHFQHHHDEIIESLRMQAVASSFIDPTIRTTRPLVSPFRGLLATNQFSSHDIADAIGYAALGPIMYTFGRFICDEITELHHLGKNPKVVFLMRDAYLPSLICEKLAGKALGKRIRISRFTAYAASFRTQNDVDLYLMDKVQSGRYEDICKQLLLPENVMHSIIKKVKAASEPTLTFIREIHKEKNLNMIFSASANARKRLRRHLEKEVDLKTGDTLVFVDLGYTGTAATKLAPVFKDEMNVDIIGRYLIALQTPQWELSRKGLLDPANYDNKALTMLVTYIALLEQMCTSNEKSVIDYDDEGNPIFSDTDMSEDQHNKLNELQAACIRFTQDAKLFFDATQIHPSLASMRDAAAINLCRLLFLPTKRELDYLQTFKFDFNLGTNEVLPIFDLEKGLTGLRRRSWLHCSKENLQNMRMNYPAEWRAASIELALTLMAQHRFGLEFALNDLSHRRDEIQILIIHDKEVSPLTLEAMPTHDGYFSILIPIINKNCQIAIQFGEKYKWLEIESAEIIKLTALYSQKEFECTEDASPYLAANEMISKSGGLFECLSSNSCLVFSPNADIQAGNYILRMVYRPIVKLESVN